VDKQARLARARSYIPDDSTVHTAPADPLTIYQTPKKTHSGCTEPSFLPVQLSSLAPQSAQGFGGTTSALAKPHSLVGRDGQSLSDFSCDNLCRRPNCPSLLARLANFFLRRWVLTPRGYWPARLAVREGTKCVSSVLLALVRGQLCRTRRLRCYTSRVESLLSSLLHTARPAVQER